MGARTSLNVSLTPDLARFLADRVSSGRYQTVSEVVREGLRLLELHERDQDLAFSALKLKLERGAAQAKRGEFVYPKETLKKINSLKRRRAGAKP